MNCRGVWSGGSSAPEAGLIGAFPETPGPAVCGVEQGALGGEASSDASAGEVLDEGLFGVTELLKRGDEIGIVHQGGETNGGVEEALFTSVGVVLKAAEDAANDGGDVGGVGVVPAGVALVCAGNVLMGGVERVGGWGSGGFDGGGVEVAVLEDEATAGGEGVLEALEDGVGGVVELALVEEGRVDELAASGLVDLVDLVLEAAV